MTGSIKLRHDAIPEVHTSCEVPPKKVKGILENDSGLSFILILYTYTV